MQMSPESLYYPAIINHSPFKSNMYIKNTRYVEKRPKELYREKVSGKKVVAIRAFSIKTKSSQ